MTILSLLGWLAGCAGPQALVAPGPVDSELRFEDPNNYRWSASLTVGSTEVAARTDFTIDWSGWTIDLIGQPLDRAVFEVSLSRLDDTTAALQDALVRDQSLSALVPMTWFLRPGEATSAQARQFATRGDDLVQLDRWLEESEPWVVMLYDTDETGSFFDLRGLHYVTPSATSTNDRVDLVDGGSTLTATPDLHSAILLQATAGAAPGRLDWSALTLDAHGQSLQSDQADELIVARVDVATAAEAEPLVAALETHAAESYRLRWVHDEDHPAPTSADLGAAVDEAGAPFAGFTSDGVWLVGLQCDHCIAPMALTVVEVP